MDTACTTLDRQALTALVSRRWCHGESGAGRGRVYQTFARKTDEALLVMKHHPVERHGRRAPYDAKREERMRRISSLEINNT